MKKVVSDGLSYRLDSELGIDSSEVSRLYGLWLEAPHLLERHFVTGEPFEKALYLEVEREFKFFKYVSGVINEKSS